MEDIISKRDGLIYSDNFKCVVGIDSSSNEFTGEVPYGVERIEEEAFSCCSLKHISLPDSVISVGANLFCNSTELESVHLPSELKKLSPFMFCGCKSLTKVEMPFELEEFEEGLFAECSSLKEIPFCNGLKVIKEGAFNNCSSITTLLFPNSIQKICAGAIVDCENLTTIVLPKNLDVLEDGWISGCDNLKHIRISEDNKSYRTNEDCEILYRKIEGEPEIVLLEIKNKSEDDIPKIKDIGEENPSIISYDEAEEESSDDTDIIFENDKKGGVNLENELETLDTQNQIGSAAEPVLQDADAQEKSMDDKLAEILGQNKMYDEGNFSIMDIPEASEEEIENAILEKKNPSEEEYTHTPVIQVEVPVEPEGSMEDRLKEIMGDNTEGGGFSIFDIPVASDAELEANKLLKEEGAHHELVEADPEQEDSDSDVPAPVEKEVDSDKAFMQNLIFETEKIVEQNTGVEGDKKLLFVFAEKLVETDLGNKFSTRLIQCCMRLAKIHKYTSIYFLHNVRLDTDKFMDQFKDFMRDRDVVIACEGGSLVDVDDRTKEFCGIVNVSLKKEDLEAESQRAADANIPVLKLLIQDNLSD